MTLESGADRWLWQSEEKSITERKSVLHSDRILAPRGKKTAGLSNFCEWKQSRGIRPSSAPSPPPPPCCFPSPPVSEVCWFVGFGLDRPRRLRSGSTQPREDWITPSIGVSCQMVSCTCCLKQGGPAAATTATARPTLEHIISASKMIMLFTHAHTHNRWLFLTPSPLSPASLRRRFTDWWGNSCSQPTFSTSNQQVGCQKLPVAISCSNIPPLPHNFISIQWAQWELV